MRSLCGSISCQRTTRRLGCDCGSLGRREAARALPLLPACACPYRRGAMSQVKLNTDESPNVASEYGIRSIPTVMIFKNGQKLDTVIGTVPKTTCVAFAATCPPLARLTRAPSATGW